MNPFLVRRVEFAMANAGSRSHALQLPGPDDRAIAHAVSVFERSPEDISDDLHIPVAVHPETLTGLHSIIVDYPQGTKAHIGRVVVISKGEGVVRVEPAMVEMASLGCSADSEH